MCRHTKDNSILDLNNFDKFYSVQPKSLRNSDLPKSSTSRGLSNRVKNLPNIENFANKTIEIIQSNKHSNHKTNKSLIKPRQKAL